MQSTPPLTASPTPPPPAALPLAGIRVVEFTHMVMGPTCGLILGDLGADVVKVEPLRGDRTRHLHGSGAGFFPLFNRNKRSIALDLQSDAGRAVAARLVASADVVSENFKAGTMEALGLDEATLRQRHPRLIYVSHKGFLPGPYSHRTALDEVVQMMGGLAYMTGRPGDPLRAGSSVNDIMGGMFGAIGVLAALVARGQGGRADSGASVASALFENNVFLVAQHMLQLAMTGAPAAPMPARISPWGIYDVFTVAGGAQIFLAVVGDTQWATFCRAFGWGDLAADARYASNNLRVTHRDTLIPELKERLAPMDATQIAIKFEANGLPFAPITKPEELFDDPHLRASGGLGALVLPDGAHAGETTAVPLLPLALDGARLPVRRSPPVLGADTRAVLASVGYANGEIDALAAAGIVGLGPDAPAV